jgi:hypothetical protein
MITQADWYEFLYTCDLIGQHWSHVNQVGTAYICWRTGVTATPYDKAQKMLDAFVSDPGSGEERLAQYLAEPHYGAQGANSIVSEENRQRIIKMLHYIVTEKPNLQEWVN